MLSEFLNPSATTFQIDIFLTFSNGVALFFEKKIQKA